MAKEKFERTKPHVNIGTIGHVDHGINLQKVVLRIHGDRTILKCITFSHWYTSLP